MIDTVNYFIIGYLGIAGVLLSGLGFLLFRLRKLERQISSLK